MIKNTVLLLGILTVANYLSKVRCFEFNMTKYFQMPNLYQLDDYDRCLEEYIDDSRYCFVRAQVRPQNNSQVWRTIEDVSSYSRHHFDHRHLCFGLCTRWCERELENLDVNATNELFEGILSSNEKVNVYLNLFSREDSNRLRYNRLLNQCINLRLKKSHGLRAESVVEYCDRSDKLIEHDAWNRAFYVMVCVLIMLATCSSIYDLFLKHQRKEQLSTDSEYYKRPVSGAGNRIGVIFSMARNWYRLNQDPVGPIRRDLRFLDCFKFCAMFFVIFAHTNWILNETAIANPQDRERMLHTAAGTLLMSGSLITMTFFVISGLLLAINWLTITKAKSELSTLEYVQYFVKFNIFRYIRLTIPYAFAILLSGVYFTNSDGPLWRHIIEREQLSCRKKWWTNLLYINNFVRTDEHCILPGWYLAADTHCFVLSLIVLMVATKWPRIRVHLCSAIIALCFIIPGAFVFVKDEEAFFLGTPQTQRDSYVGDEHFVEFYTPFYMNFGPYFFGVLAALIYHEFSHGQHKLHLRRDFQILWYSLIPIGIFWIFLAHPLYQYHQNRPSIIWRGLFAAVQRNVWGLGFSVLIIGMCVKVGWIFRKFACLPIFRMLGRLTYGAFILHMFVGRIVVASLRQPMYFGTGLMLALTIFNVAASYLFSLILAIFLELPVSSFLKLLR